MPTKAKKGKARNSIEVVYYLRSATKCKVSTYRTAKKHTIHTMFAPDRIAPKMYALSMFAQSMFAPKMFAPDRVAANTFAPNIWRRSPLPTPSSGLAPPAPAKKTGSSTSDAASSSRWRKPYSWLKNVKQPNTRGRCSSAWNFRDQSFEMNDWNMSKQVHNNTLKVVLSILVLNRKLKLFQFDSGICFVCPPSSATHPPLTLHITHRTHPLISRFWKCIGTPDDWWRYRNCQENDSWNLPDTVKVAPKH